MMSICLNSYIYLGPEQFSTQTRVDVYPYSFGCINGEWHIINAGCCFIPKKNAQHASKLAAEPHGSPGLYAFSSSRKTAWTSPSRHPAAPCPCWGSSSSWPGRCWSLWGNAGAYIHTYIQDNLYLYVYLFIGTVFIYLYIYIYLSICLFIYLYLNLYIYIFICIYIYI